MEGRILYTVRDNKKSKKRIPARVIWIWVVFLSLVFLLAGAVYLLRLPYWQIKKVEIKGLVIVDPADINTKVNNFISGRKFFLLPQSSYLLFNSNDLALLLKQDFPRLEQVLVKKTLPDSLEVVVKERELFGVFCSSPQDLENKIWEGKCVYIDKTGFAYNAAPVSSGSLLLKIKSDAAEARVGAILLDQDLMNDFMLLSEGLEKVAGIRPVAFEFFSQISSEIKVETSGGFKILFKRGDNFENAFRVLKTVLEQEIYPHTFGSVGVKGKRAQLEYIDLRFGNKVFYRFTPTPN